MTLRTETKSVEGTPLRPSNEDQVNFQRSVDESLAQIRSTEVGASLLDDIVRAGHELLIVKAIPNRGNKCIQTEPTMQAGAAACYREVLSYRTLQAKVQELTSTGQITAQHPAVRKFMKFYAPQASGGNKEVYAYRVKQKDLPLAHKKGEQRDSEVLAGEKSVSSLQRGLIAYHIMDDLTPGPGTGAKVLWDPSSVQICKDLSADRRTAWMDRPAWVALAHELIHGWRLVTGRCVFQPAGGIEEYWEEAMTVGLPPYDGCRFTENRFRNAKALPLRTYYGESTLNRSKAASAKHGEAVSRLLIKIVGSGPNDPLVFDYDIRSAHKPDEITHGTTDVRGRATASAIDGEIRFRGFGAFGRVETQWQKILLSRQMTLQFGRYSFICEPLIGS